MKVPPGSVDPKKKVSPARQQYLMGPGRKFKNTPFFMIPDPW
jgi:hypothetical protein